MDVGFPKGEDSEDVRLRLPLRIRNAAVRVCLEFSFTGPPKSLACGTSFRGAMRFIMKTNNLPTTVLIGTLLAIALPGAVAPARAQSVESPPTRTIRVATKEVTDPDVAVSSDGRWLVFTALGHLVQLPAAGGATKQLTSGPFYDSEPTISPDGTRVAFISDRKVSSQGNVFVLGNPSGQIRQVTDEFWASRSVWSPDGKSVAFLSYQRIGHVSNYLFVGPQLVSQVRRVRLVDGKVETLTEPGFVHAVAFLADGRPVWSIV